MHLICCSTNLCVNIVMSQILNDTKTSFILLTDLDSILLLFNELKLPNVEIFHIKKTADINFIQIIKEKNRIRKYLRSKEIDYCYFYHQAFGGIYNWTITYLSHRKHKILFNRVTPPIELPRARSVNAIKQTIIYKVIYNTEITCLNRGNHIILPQLSKAFFQKNKIEFIDITPQHEKNERYICQKFLPNINRLKNKIVLLTGSVVESLQVDQNEYKEKINLLINEIGKEQIISKRHPRFNDLIGIEKELFQLPYFIPMDLFKNSFSIYIGYNSTLLAEAANNGALSISLINYMNPIDCNRRNNWFKYFENILKEGKQIHYPQTLSEIILLLNPHKQHYAKNQ